MLEPELLNMVRCPETGCRLVYIETKNELWCRASNKAYSIKNGVPILIINTARSLENYERENLSRLLK